MLRIVWIATLFLGCTKVGTDTGDSALINGPTHTIWSGWNHSWEMLSHRVSLIDVKPGPPGEATSGILGGDWSTGDTWSDEVNHRIHQQHVTGHELTAESGSVTLTVPPEGATATTRIEMNDAQIAILNGFSINTDIAQSDAYPTDYDPALGYTSRGFALGVTLTDDGQVEVTADVRWGPQDRDAMNRALAVADTEVTVHFMVLSTPAAVQTARFTATQELEHEPPYSEQAGAEQALNWTGFGVAGVASFALMLNETDGGDGGDYLRSFGVEMNPGSAGAPPETVAAEILTTSAIELATMTMAVNADLVWIPLDPQESRVDNETITGIHPVGTFTVPIGSET